VPVKEIAPTSSIARSLRDLAETIAPPAASPQRGGWFAGFLGNGAAAR